jgi:diguanylate cyclase (GGDEF)-like protein
MTSDRASSSKQSSRRGTREYVYTGLLLLSLLLVTWQHYGMNQWLTVDLGDPAQTSPFNDDVNGGQSDGRLSFPDGLPTMDCQIILSDAFAFCGMHIRLSALSETLDLRGYDSLYLDVEYAAEEHDTLLIYLLNEETENGVDRVRSNQTTIVPTIGRSTYRLELKDLFVPSWWVFHQQADVSAQTRIDNVSKLQVSTGDNTVARSISFTVHGVRFSGKWLSDQTLVTSLLVFWTAVALVQVGLLVFRFNRMYHKTRAESRELNAVNRLLRSERDKLESLAKQDKLTGCLNRHGMSEVLNTVVREFNQSKRAVSLVMLDIDHFKSLNDNFGHDQGDQVLSNLAELLRNHLRDSDHLVRWGGEEFAIICFDTHAQGAGVLAEKLRALVEQTQLMTDTRVTLSFGVSQLHEEGIDHWFKQADEALYRAKANGRNRVELSAHS